MDVFALRDHLIQDYHGYISSFIQIRDHHLRRFVNQILGEGLLWPDSLIQLNPAFEPGHYIDELADEGLLDKVWKAIFRRKNEVNPSGSPLRLHKYQEEAIRVARTGWTRISRRDFPGAEGQRVTTVWRVSHTAAGIGSVGPAGGGGGWEKNRG